jgi:hypothetical protein
MQRAVVRIRTVRTLTTDRIIGYRLEAAIPNNQGRVMKARHDGAEVVGFYATDAVNPSFTRAYLIEQSSDCSCVTTREVGRFLANLKRQGFDTFNAIGKWHNEFFGLFDHADKWEDMVRWMD